MSMTIIELNDSEIRLSTDGNIVLRQPGYAVLKDEMIYTGEAARQMARSHPRLTYNRYWGQLNQDPLIVPSALARHHADLAYAQLLALHEQAGRPDEIIFALPGSYTREQLAMLLGITQSCPFTAVGLVDSAVAAAAAVAGPGKYSHLDIHLHYTVITDLDIDATVTRGAIRLVNDTGITGIYETCAGHFAGAFIDQARFDPLHHAQSEQELYNGIPAALRSLQSVDELTLEINYKDKRYQARIAREALLERLQHLYDSIYQEIAGRPGKLISDRLHALPGFSERLPEAFIIDEQSIFHGCNANLQNIRATGPSLSFTTTLPATKNPVTAADGNEAATPVANKKVEATGTNPHILINHRARPPGPAPLYVSAAGTVTSARSSGEHHCSFRQTADGIEVRAESELTVFINGNRLSAACILNIGDTISFAGTDTTVRLIEVVTD